MSYLVIILICAHSFIKGQAFQSTDHLINQSNILALMKDDLGICDFPSKDVLTYPESVPFLAQCDRNIPHFNDTYQYYDVEFLLCMAFYDVSLRICEHVRLNNTFIIEQLPNNSTALMTLVDTIFPKKLNSSNLFCSSLQKTLLNSSYSQTKKPVSFLNKQLEDLEKCGHICFDYIKNIQPLCLVLLWGNSLLSAPVNKNGKATELYLTTLNDNIGLTKGDNKTTADVIPSNKDPSRWQENPVRKTPPNLMQDDQEKPSQENRNKPAVQINQTDPLSVGPVQSPQTAPGASVFLVKPEELFVPPSGEENLTRQVSSFLSANKTLNNTSIATQYNDGNKSALTEAKKMNDTNKMVEQSKESLDGINKTIAHNNTIKPNTSDNNITVPEATVESIEKLKTHIETPSNTYEQSSITLKEKTAMDGEAKEQIQKGSLYEPENVLKVNDADITKDITFKVPGLETKSGEAEELPLNLQNNEEDNLSIGDYNQGEAPMDSDTDMSGADEHTDINDRVNVESEPDVPPAQNLEDGDLSLPGEILTPMKSGNDNDGNERQTGKMPAEGPDDTAYNRGGAFSDDEDSHFFAYFMTMVLICIIGYLVFHNKQKGRSRKGSRRRPNTAGYRKLDSNLEEAVTSSCSQSVTHVIY
uniref:Trans-Golgi network integral membrane protein 2 n=1 Tax=Timema genevievae TaxID=629358 RepID=A0A7R9PP59_TIMGE|nr:unnamed protein product [Timema genevievae]